MPAHFSISRTSRNPIVFAGLGCAQNAGWGAGLEFRSSFSLSASNARGWLEQQPGALEQGVGDTAFPPCIGSCCRGEANVRLWGEQKLKTDFFFSVVRFFFSTLPFPIFLACLWSPEWVIQGLSYNCVQKTIWDQSEMLLQPVLPSDCST